MHIGFVFDVSHIKWHGFLPRLRLDCYFFPSFWPSLAFFGGSVLYVWDLTVHLISLWLNNFLVQPAKNSSSFYTRMKKLEFFHASIEAWKNLSLQNVGKIYISCSPTTASQIMHSCMHQITFQNYITSIYYIDHLGYIRYLYRHYRIYRYCIIYTCFVFILWLHFTVLLSVIAIWKSIEQRVV